ncbi:MAG: hypothetical protein ACE5FY_07470, partial [Nitrospiria bacterium]
NKGKTSTNEVLPLLFPGSGYWMTLELSVSRLTSTTSLIIRIFPILLTQGTNDHFLMTFSIKSGFNAWIEVIHMPSQMLSIVKF